MLNEEKNPNYVGTFRGRYCNSWDVTTETEKPLAQEISQMLSRLLQKKWFKPAPVTLAPKDSLEDDTIMSLILCSYKL